MLGHSRRTFAVLLIVTAVSTLLYSRTLFTRHHDRNHSLARRLMGMVRENPSSPFNQSQSPTSSQVIASSQQHTSSRPSSSSRPRPTCTERRRLGFAKNHKVGGDTIKRIFDRFGYVRKLNFVLPRSLVVSKMYPYQLYPTSYLPPPQNQSFDMLVYHTVYERERYREILPKDTVYLTIIREPLSHLKSTWNYYKLQKKFHIEENGEDPILTFLANPGEYDKKCGHGRHVPYCLTQNAISTDLGFPASTNKRVGPGCDTDEREIITQKFLKIIKDDFDLVMMTEYFDESLVLLKRLMCWSLKDILYYKTNTRSYVGKEKQIPPKLHQNHREWSHVDYALYDQFNQSFWRRINSAGNDFWGEVRYFKHVNEQMKELCDSYKASKPCSISTLNFKDSRWGPGFTVDRNFCMLAKRSLRCYLLLESERAAKALRLNRRNITTYSKVDLEAFKKAAKSRKGRTTVKAIDVILENCVNCKLRDCGSLDHLSHLHYDGYVNSATYSSIVNREYPNFVRKCNV